MNLACRIEIESNERFIGIHDKNKVRATAAEAERNHIYRMFGEMKRFHLFTLQAEQKSYLFMFAENKWRVQARKAARPLHFSQENRNRTPFWYRLI